MKHLRENGIISILQKMIRFIEAKDYYQDNASNKAELGLESQVSNFWYNALSYTVAVLYVL